MRDLVNASIDGDNYIFGFLDLDVSVETFTEILGMVAPIFAAMAKSAATTEADLDTEITELVASKKINLEGIAQQLSTQLQPKVASRLMRTLCSCVNVAGARSAQLDGANYSNHFAGRPEIALEVALKSFVVNGGLRFFAKGGNLVTTFKAGSTLGPQA